jgi:hypothetical protein
MFDQDIHDEELAYEAEEDRYVPLDPATEALLADEAYEAASYYEGLTYEDYEANPYDGTYSEA